MRIIIVRTWYGHHNPSVNFSVPEDVKVAFNTTFCKENKSAIIAALMREAVDRAQRKDRARQAATRILERRESAPIVSTAECREAREKDRP
ncbi:hypothetical protein [Acidithiobacillus ferrivorans]|uniref:hypothetical protein n=1 Tax=Acidithiobacillus ferrivorans TaxID=160808 RepID=UPI001C0695F9|nr:hypothetical protein [Acidithiobacillus ferrivorans]MBU2849539.1 hypothetical protein [Acidithiobacillus ferrivorans]